MLSLALVLSALGLSLSSAPGGAWAIAPGHEGVFSQVTLPGPGELPEGWVRLAISVPKDRVEVRYGPKGQAGAIPCDEAPICLTLSHPESAPEGAVVQAPFALSVTTRGADPSVDALLTGVRQRIAARGPPSPFKAIKVKLPSADVPKDAVVVAEDSADSAALSERFGEMLTPDPELKRRLLRVEVSPQLVRYVLRTDSGDPPEAIIELRDRAPRQSDPREVTRSFYVRGLGGVTDPPDLARRVHAALLESDDGALRLAAGDALATGERPPLHSALIGIVLFALLGLVLVLPKLLALSARELRLERLPLALLGLGALLRLSIEGRLVEMGIGYQLTRYADELLMPRYGAGTTTLHHLVFQLFGVDHDVMLWTHRVLGVLTLPMAYVAGLGLVERAREGRAWLGPAWAGALALSPILVKSDATESNLVPVLFALWAALLAWQRLRGPLALLGVLSGLTFVALSRPEMAVIGPGIWIALSRPWERPKEALWVMVPLVAAVCAQLVFIQQVIDWEIGVQSLHLGKELSSERLLTVIANNALFDPTLAPSLLIPLGLFALSVPETRAVVLTLLVGGLAWVYVYAVDLSAASMPRLHIVVVLAWSLAAALGLAELARRRLTLAVVAGALWSLGALVTIPTLWAPTNEDTQQRLFDRVASSLPEQGGYVLALLATSDAPDPPGHFTHRHTPSYLFKSGSVSTLGDLERWVGGDAPVYYFQGTSCYARLLRSKSDERGLLAPCAALHRAFELEPVWTERVLNHGNPVHQELGYYSDEAHFEVGLWRVVGRAANVQP